MKKKALLVVALLLAVSITMAAMAYNSAYVWNAQTLRVVSTNQALIALDAKAITEVGNKDGTAEIKNGQLVFDFGKSGLGGATGLQPNSEYTWKQLFSIQNKSAEDITVRITIDNELANRLKLVDQGGTVFYNKSNASPYITLTSGQTVVLDAIITLHGTTPLGTTGNSLMVNCAAK